MGSSVEDNAQPVLDLFKFITTELGTDNKLLSIIGTRLAIVNQVKMSKEELSILYPKLKLPLKLVEQDFQRNQELLKKCYELGKNLSR